MEQFLLSNGLVFVNEDNLEIPIQNKMANLELQKVILSAGIRCVKQINFTMDNEHFVFDESIDLKKLVKKEKVHFFAFCNRLSGKQMYELQKEYDVEVFDCVLLYLKAWQIFSTNEITKLRVNIAKLNYMLPYYQYLCEKEKQDFESYQILLRFYKMNLADKVSKNKRKKKNHPFPVVSLIGQMNTGKTTLYNELSGLYGRKIIHTFPFTPTTIDSKESKIRFKDGKSIILKDNISFYTYLPEELLDIYQDLLKEAFKADLLIDVEDIGTFLQFKNNSNVKIPRSLPIIEVLNKVDVDGMIEIMDTQLIDNLFFISASHHLNFNVLENHIKKYLSKYWKTCTMFIPCNEIHILKQITKSGHVLKRQDLLDGTKITIEISNQVYNQYIDYVWIEGKN